MSNPQTGFWPAWTIAMIRPPPVRPHTLSPHDTSGGDPAPAMAAQPGSSAEDDVNFKEAIMDAPIIGVEQGETQGPTARPDW